MMLSTTAVRLSGRRTAAVLSTVVPPPFSAFSNLISNQNSSRKFERATFSTRPKSCHSSQAIAIGGWYREHINFKDDMKQSGIQWFSSKTKGQSKAQSKSPFDADVQSLLTPPKQNAVASGSSQHETWVEFQRSIAVSGFETGQTIKEQILGKKHRGGKMDRKRKEREAEMEAAMSGADVTNVSQWFIIAV